MQRLICPNCGYSNAAFNGSVVVVIEAEVTVTIDRKGNLKPALARRVNIRKGKLGDDPMVKCPNCGEEFKALEIVRFGCSHCGREIPKEDIEEHFCRSSLDLRCVDHIDTYYCDGCRYAGECKLLEKIRNGE